MYLLTIDFDACSFSAALEKLFDETKEEQFKWMMVVILPRKNEEGIVKKYQDECLGPLNCIDQYLDQFDRLGLYYTISAGISDKQGRWQAFLDYYNNVRKKLDDDYKRTKMGTKEIE